VPVPLDLDSVTLKLWPVENQSEADHQMMGLNEEGLNGSE
jgi:hypothetical protein